MTQQIDDQMKALFDTGTAHVVPDPAVVGRAVLSGRHRRRRRRIGYGVGAAAAAAVVGFAATTFGLPGSGPGRPEVLAGRPASPAPAPPERLPTLPELTATLAAALPASTPLAAEEGTQDWIVNRQLRGGLVQAWAYEQPGAKGHPMTDAEVATWMADYCSHQSRVSGCRVTAEGWATWVAAKPDVPRVGKHSWHIQVRYVRRDGLVIALDASNFLDVATPTATAPVLSRDQLIELATTVDWFPPA